MEPPGAPASLRPFGLPARVEAWSEESPGGPPGLGPRSARHTLGPAVSEGGREGRTRGFPPAVTSLRSGECVCSRVRMCVCVCICTRACIRIHVYTVVSLCARVCSVCVCVRGPSPCPGPPVNSAAPPRSCQATFPRATAPPAGMHVAGHPRPGLRAGNPWPFRLAMSWESRKVSWESPPGRAGGQETGRRG